jgi:hypothetical protein
MADIAAPLDFLGVNYYYRAIVRSTAIPERDNAPRTTHLAPASDGTDMGLAFSLPKTARASRMAPIPADEFAIRGASAIFAITSSRHIDPCAQAFRSADISSGRCSTTSNGNAGTRSDSDWSGSTSTPRSGVSRTARSGIARSSRQTPSTPCPSFCLSRPRPPAPRAPRLRAIRAATPPASDRVHARP